MYFFFQAEDGIRDGTVTGVQTCALPILLVLGGDRGGAGEHHRPPRPADPAVLEHARLQRVAAPTASAAGDRKERRVGKECSSRWSPDHQKKKKNECRMTKRHYALPSTLA